MCFPPGTRCSMTAAQLDHRGLRPAETGGAGGGGLEGGAGVRGWSLGVDVRVVASTANTHIGLPQSQMRYGICGSVDGGAPLRKMVARNCVRRQTHSDPI